jgi:hypothetical protein
MTAIDRRAVLGTLLGAAAVAAFGLALTPGSAESALLRRTSSRTRSSSFTAAVGTATGAAGCAGGIGAVASAVGADSRRRAVKRLATLPA